MRIGDSVHALEYLKPRTLRMSQRSIFHSITSLLSKNTCTDPRVLDSIITTTWLHHRQRARHLVHRACNKSQRVPTDHLDINTRSTPRTPPSTHTGPRFTPLQIAHQPLLERPLLHLMVVLQKLLHEPRKRLAAFRVAAYLDDFCSISTDL